MKKIYFACSIRGGRNDAPLYKELVEFLKTKSIVLTEIFADGKLTSNGMDKSDSEIHSTDMNWIHEADAVIAEVTNPSLGVGYEIGRAEALGKPILALFRSIDGKRLSAMIAGSPETETLTYETVDNAKEDIVKFIKSLEN